ncbi:MAG: hypothetical protein ABSE53_14565 [Terracidiphilus sp.]|jgi:hypothetical protein
MHTEFAGRDEHQCGQRFLDSSVPRLIRHVASGETAGGVIILPAGKDEKLSPELEGGALIGRAAPVPSSLDSITNNRHTSTPDPYARPVGRGKYCGRLSVKGKDPKTNRTVFRRINCGSWSCSYCGPRKAKTARRAIRARAEELALQYFLTLTLDPSKLKDGENPVRHLRLTFDKLREYLRRHYEETPAFIFVLEFTQRGIPHAHVLIDRYIEQKWISKTWDRLGGGRIVFINQVTVRHVARYLSKYLTKELLLSAPKGTRRITSSRSIKLFPKYNSEISWELLRESIWQLLAAYWAASFGKQLDLFRFFRMQFDEELFLKSFEFAEDG